MNKHINYQIIEKNGLPLFAILPYEDLVSLLKSVEAAKVEDVTIPDAIVKMVVIDEINPIKAWRKYLKFSQQELARKMGVKQPAIAKLENTSINSLRKETLIKVAKALGIKTEQLTL